jgi:catechol 2,3-dioxygenase-like lactoylglutathione lyase family enzyme
MHSIPVLHVSESQAAEDFYCGLLGFERRSCYRPHKDRIDPCYLTVHRDGAWLHLSSFRDDSVPGAAVYLLVEDVGEMYEELKGKGVTAALEPTDQSWGNREMYVRDPDGNSIRFVEEQPARRS